MQWKPIASYLRASGRRSIGFETPGYRLSRYRTKYEGTRLRITSRLLGAAYHFTHVDDNFGERQSAALFSSDPRSYGFPQRIYECGQACVIGRAELARKPSDATWGFFHERLGGREGVASSAGIPPRIEADRKCGLVGTSRTGSRRDSTINLSTLWSSRRHKCDPLALG